MQREVAERSEDGRIVRTIALAKTIPHRLRGAPFTQGSHYTFAMLMHAAYCFEKTKYKEKERKSDD